MNKSETVRDILYNLGRAESVCHACRADAVEDMVDAARDIDVVISGMTGTRHRPDSPSGDSGVLAARFFLREAREKAMAFPADALDERTPYLLENVLAASGEICAGLSL